MCSDIRCAARSASPALGRAQDRRVLGDRALQVPAQRAATASDSGPSCVEQLVVELAQLLVAGGVDERRVEGARSPRRTRPPRRARRGRPSRRSAARARRRPSGRGAARRACTAIISSASRTWYSSRNSSFESDRTTAPRRGRTVTSPSAASRPIASRSGPRLTPELLGQSDLGELGPRLEPAGEDLGAQVVVHALPESQILDGRRTESGLGCHCNHSPDGLGLSSQPTLLTVCKSDPNTGSDKEQGRESRGCTSVYLERKVLAAVAVLALVGAGTASRPARSSSAKVTKVAFASPAKQSDYGWNQQGYNAAKAAAAAIGAQVPGRDQHRLRQDRRRPAAARAGRREASSSRTRAATTRSRPASRRQYKVPVMTYDVPTNLTKGLVSYITTSSQQAAYLAGVLAAQDDEDPQGRDHHLGLGFQLVQDERRVRGGLPQRRQDVEDLLRDRSARPATTTRPAASASPTA